MVFSYKTRQFLRRLGSALLALLLLCAVALVCFSVWLRRYIVYTPDGARLDFSLSDGASQGQTPNRPDYPKIDISFSDGETEEEEVPILMDRLSGYYIDAKMMQNDMEGLRQRLAELPAGTAVMMDLKSFWGYYYYSTNLGPSSDSYILAEVDALIAQLASSELYLIGRLPALRDYTYALNNTSCGLATKKGYLWVDSSSCYWLDPTKDGTLSYLIHIAKELRELGFDEVVFQDFYVPESTGIVFKADRKEAIEAAAATLVTACASDSFTVSFVGYTLDLKLPRTNCRLYLTGVAAVDVADVLAQVSVGDKTRNVVFFAETNDTRYDVSGTLRPLELAH